MTDDLVKRLREEWMGMQPPSMCLEAADCIEKLAAANLQQSLIKLDDMRRIEKLEAALDDALQYVSRADWHYLKDETREALEELQ